MKRLKYLAWTGWLFLHFAVSAQTDSLTQRLSFRKSQLLPPVLLLSGGVALSGDNFSGFRFQVKDQRNRSFSGFHTHLDDFIPFVPIGLVYGLDAVGVRARTDVVNRTVILAKSQLVMTVATFGLKNITHELRPDESDFHSFPSGHTAQAFMAATFLHYEYGGKKRPWLSVLAFTTASAVGGLRILNNKHYLNDVLAGAGIGMLSTQVCYWTHRYRWNVTGKKRYKGTN